MSTTSTIREMLDQWLDPNSDVGGLVLREYLIPLEGRDAVFFPPTYLLENDKPGYNIDEFTDENGRWRNVCLVDSVGSQANRMEPIFLRSPYSELVPQIFVEGNGQRVSILELGHRAADAAIRFSEATEELQEAFQELLRGKSGRLAEFAPTSIVFGAWDSRDTQAKIPRVLRSVIRAFNVVELTRSAQYFSSVQRVAGKKDFETLKDLSRKLSVDLSKEGMDDVPRPKEPGGVLLRDDGYIRRDVAVILSTVRSLRAAGDGRPEDEATRALQRYVLGLTLVAATAPMDFNLRQGCELVRDPNKPARWQVVHFDGRVEPVDIPHDQALEYAQEAAKDFGVGKSQTFHFKIDQAEEGLKARKNKGKKK